MGINVDLIIGKVDPNLICSICHDVFLNPVTLEDGCTFCKRCIESWFNYGREVCPNDRNHVSSAPRPAVSRVLNEIVNKLKMRCIFFACEEQFLIENYDTHWRSCRHNPETNPEVLELWTELVKKIETQHDGCKKVYEAEKKRVGECLKELSARSETLALRVEKMAKDSDNLRQVIGTPLVPEMAACVSTVQLNCSLAANVVQAAERIDFAPFVHRFHPLDERSLQDLESALILLTRIANAIPDTDANVLFYKDHLDHMDCYVISCLSFLLGPSGNISLVCENFDEAYNRLKRWSTVVYLWGSKSRAFDVILSEFSNLPILEPQVKRGGILCELKGSFPWNIRCYNDQMELLSPAVF